MNQCFCYGVASIEWRAMKLKEHFFSNLANEDVVITDSARLCPLSITWTLRAENSPAGMSFDRLMVLTIYALFHGAELVRQEEHTPVVT